MKVLLDSFHASGHIFNSIIKLNRLNHIASILE